MVALKKFLFVVHSMKKHLITQSVGGGCRRLWYVCYDLCRYSHIRAGGRSSWIHVSSL